MRASVQGGRPLVLFALATAVVFCLDQLSKALAEALIHQAIPLIGGLAQLTFTRNVGFAFGLAAAPWMATTLSALICAAMLAYAVSGRLFRAPAQAVPLGLVTGGALGNLWDRLLTGAVIDFIDLRVWPVFNLADAAITVGVAMLALPLLRRR